MQNTNVKWHYHILDVNNNIIHDSKKGVAKKGFNDPVKATEDGELIGDLKYPGGIWYVKVYPEEIVPETHN